MEALMRWWRERLSRRERRALIVLAVVAPAIIVWFGVTRPLLEKRETLERAGRSLEQKVRELEPLLRRADDLGKQGIGFPSVEPEPLPLLEAVLAKGSSEYPMPELVPVDATMGIKKIPAAQIRMTGWRTGTLWRMLSRLVGSGWLVSEFDLSASGEKQEMDGYLNVWRKKVP